MNLSSFNEVLQLAALFLATIEFILTLYVLLLNPWHKANRHVSALLFLGALTTLAQGLLIGAVNVGQAYIPTVILSATVVPVQPALVIVSVVLLKPAWLPGSGRTRGHGWWRWLWVLVYLFAFVPLVLTLIDVARGTQLWYTGLDAATYSQGAVSTADFTAGTLAAPIKLLAFQILPLLAFVPLLYVALRDRTATRLTRRLAWILLVQQICIVGVALGLRQVLPVPIPDLLSTAVFVFTYTYVIFQQMVSERRVQRGRLRPRITMLVLVVAVPLLAMVPLLLSMRASTELEQDAAERLAITNRSLGANVSTWLKLNIQSLQELVTLPGVVSFDPDQQTPILEAFASAHPHMYLVSTTDLYGINVARNDDEGARVYSDRPWFLGARDGNPLTFQTLIGRTSGQPALVASMPVRDQSGKIIGVGMFASNLADIVNEVEVSTLGITGFAYVVDADNMLIAHPDPAFSEAEDLIDVSDTPPVAALRQGTRGLMAFTDEEGRRWQAYVDELEYGWGIVVQQQEAELLMFQRSFQGLSWMLIGVGTVVLLVLTWMTIAQAFRPINALTDTAGAIAGGVLTAEAPVESEDEIGALARTFNSMTGQLRDLIGSLEQRVADRTQDLQRRTRYLEATAEVGRAAASILETDQLIQDVVKLVRERFDLYYVGLFLVDGARQWAVLRAGTGQAGQSMLARGHRIRVGEGMIGWTVARGELRVAQLAEEDAVRLATAELPDTRSEAALPLRSRGQVLGALSVQDTRPGVFDEATMTVLQTMADQVAVAISNAQLFQQAEAALEAERRAYGELGREAWRQLLSARSRLGYRCDLEGVRPVAGGGGALDSAAQYSGGEWEGTAQDASTTLPELALPIRVHDEVLGTIQAHKADGTEHWTAEEVELMEAMSEQLGVALESARLYHETQRRAAREQLTRAIADTMRRATDIDSLMRTAAQEMAAALGTSSGGSAFVQLSAPLEPAGDGGGNGDEGKER
jgi:GAF domain-containing protein/HAMP domain-containing protein